MESMRSWRAILPTITSPLIMPMPCRGPFALLPPFFIEPAAIRAAIPSPRARIFASCAMPKLRHISPSAMIRVTDDFIECASVYRNN